MENEGLRKQELIDELTKKVVQVAKLKARKDEQKPLLEAVRESFEFLRRTSSS
jgi:hypothetical protein